jgi:hypothetical protein
MSKLSTTALSRALCGALLLPCAAGAAEIANIDFSEVPLLSQDPTIDGLSFFAGNPVDFADTITDDAATPGNVYLQAGVDDLPDDFVPYTETSFIGASAASAIGGTGYDVIVNLEAAFLSVLPSGESAQFDLMLGTSVQGSDSFTTALNAYLPLQVTLNDIAFDNLRVYVPSDFGSSFIIDNLTINVIGSGPGPTPTPAPGPLLLLAAGGLGLQWVRGRRATAC